MSPPTRRTLEVLRDCVAQVKLQADDCYMRATREDPDLYQLHELLRAVLAAASEADAVIARALKLPDVQP